MSSSFVNAGYFVQVDENHLTTSGRIKEYATYADMLAETDVKIKYASVLDASADPTPGVGAGVRVFYERVTVDGVKKWQLLYHNPAEGVERIVNTTDTDVSLAVEGGKAYVFTQPLTSLTLTSVVASEKESAIVFTTSGTNTTVSYPTSVDVIGFPTFEAGKSYVISIWNNMLSASVYTPGVQA